MQSKFGHYHERDFEARIKHDVAIRQITSQPQVVYSTLLTYRNAFYFCDQFKHIELTVLLSWGLTVISWL